MLQLQTLRNQKEHVLERLQVKHVANLSIVDQILAIDEERRKVQAEHDALLSRINAASKEIGMLMGSGKKEEAEVRKAEVASHKEAAKTLSETLAELEKRQQEQLVTLPNLPHTSVPLGRHAEDNEVVRLGNTIPVLPADAMPHWDLAKK